MRALSGRMMMSLCLLLLLARPAAAQYLRITTDNPTDNTRMRATGTTVLTFTLDTNHDKGPNPDGSGGAIQTCNSHTGANCGAGTTAESLDIGGYHLLLHANGGTVTFGTFAHALGGSVLEENRNSTDYIVDYNLTAYAGPGLVTMGTLPVTILTGAPSIDFARSSEALSPGTYPTGFGTHCSGFAAGNTYTIGGDPTDLCGNTTGFSVDFSDVDGAKAPAVANSPPVLAQPANMTVNEGATADQVLSATDADGNPLTFSKVTGPTYATVTTTTGGTGTATGNLHLAPGFADAGTTTLTVQAADASTNNQKTLTVTVNNVNRAPVLNPVANMTASVGCGTAVQPISASDPDGDPLTFSKVAGPTFMTVTTTSPTTGEIRLTPGVAEPLGTSTATVRASDGALNFDRTFAITVSQFSAPPTLNQPANMTVTEGATADQIMTASDACGTPLFFSKVSGPSFVTVTTLNSGSGTASGNLHLAPVVGDAGTSFATIQVTDGALTNQKSLTITVVPPGNRAPVLNPISDMTIPEGDTQDQAISGSDPDGDALTFSKVNGPSFMTVTTTSPTTGNIHVATTFTSAGVYTGTVSAFDGSLSSARSFTINVCLGCRRAPVLAPVNDMTVTEGTTADQTITAVDPDGDPITFTKATGPIFMTVSTTSPGTGNGTGLIHLAPGNADAGIYNASAGATDGILTNIRTFTITALTSGNRCPVAGPGGPYSGLVAASVSFFGNGSSDPDGNPLTYAWDFDASNGITVDAVGILANHVYSAVGNYTVTLTVTDNGDGDPAQVCSASATTTAAITSVCFATIFNGYDTIRLGSGKPLWFAYVQPSDGCYSNSDVILSSFVLRYLGRSVPAEVTKKVLVGDTNGDGIEEIKVTVSKANLRTLLADVPQGNSAVSVTIAANTTLGRVLQGVTVLQVVNNGNFTASEVSPNPLNPEATLTYTTTRQGAVRIDLFDIQGRLVRRLVDNPAMAAGTHEAIIDGRGSRGEKLPSGVYYIRGTSAEGEFKHLITILK